jgi:ubiquinone/menaquinone biosynthesis C-methylase UbiE
VAQQDVSEIMRAEWNERAREDANYFVAFGRRDQDDEEFFATGADVVRELVAELKRLPACRRALEIGCGPGRLLRPMSRHFDEVHGIDVSDEMIRLAREKLRGVANAHVHCAGGSDLAIFADGLFDFVYSYAVFQHIPSRDVVFNYLREAVRVLRPEGVLKCQINGLPQAAARYTTWDGVRIAGAEVKQFAREQRVELLALTGDGTQYMWATLRKPMRAALRAISNAYSGEAAVPSEGRFASASIWIESLPAGADLNSLEVLTDSVSAEVTYVGMAGELAQVNARLPRGIRTGMVPVVVLWRGEELAPAYWMRVIPPGPAVPRVAMVSDGVNLLSTRSITSGAVKLSIEELADPSEVGVSIDRTPVNRIEWFCTDPVARLYEFNFSLPAGLKRGWHHLHIRAGKRQFAPVPVEVN